MWVVRTSVFIIFSPYHCCDLLTHCCFPAMARGPQWLIVDSTRGINQEKWILDHARENLVKFVGPAPEYKTRSSYAQAIAEAFDEHWSRKLPIYNKKAGRMETEDEALLRTGNRPMVRRISPDNRVPLLMRTNIYSKPKNGSRITGPRSWRDTKRRL